MNAKERKTRSFHCNCCGGTFTTRRPEAEAYQEYLEVIPQEHQTIEDDVMVCTDCYILILIKNGIPVPPEYLTR